jgi:hypothetical protein
MAQQRRRHTPEQIIRKLGECGEAARAGGALPGPLRHLEIGEATWYRWRNQYGRSQMLPSCNWSGRCRVTGQTPAACLVDLRLGL